MDKDKETVALKEMDDEQKIDAWINAIQDIMAAATENTHIAEHLKICANLTAYYLDLNDTLASTEEQIWKDEQELKSIEGAITASISSEIDRDTGKQKYSNEHKLKMEVARLTMTDKDYFKLATELWSLKAERNRIDNILKQIRRFTGGSIPS